VGTHKRKHKDSLKSREREPFAGFYAVGSKTDADDAAPLIRHRERAEYLSALQRELGRCLEVTSAFTHVNTYPVLCVFRVGDETKVLRVVVVYRDGDWWLSWNQVGVRAHQTAEAARMLADTLTYSRPDARDRG
jgi:hypothetical protein